MLGVWWGYTRSILEVCWGYTRSILEVCWGYAGDMLGVSWGYPGGILGVCWGVYRWGYTGVCWGDAGGMLGCTDLVQREESFSESMWQSYGNIWHKVHPYRYTHVTLSRGNLTNTCICVWGGEDVREKAWGAWGEGGIELSLVPVAMAALEMPLWLCGREFGPESLTPSQPVWRVCRGVCGGCVGEGMESVWRVSGRCAGMCVGVCGGDVCGCVCGGSVCKVCVWVCVWVGECVESVWRVASFPGLRSQLTRWKAW